MSLDKTPPVMVSIFYILVTLQTENETNKYNKGYMEFVGIWENISLKEAFFLGGEMNFFDKIGWVLQ